MPGSFHLYSALICRYLIPKWSLQGVIHRLSLMLAWLGLIQPWCSIERLTVVLRLPQYMSCQYNGAHLQAIVGCGKDAYLLMLNVLYGVLAALRTSSSQ